MSAKVNAALAGAVALALLALAAGQPISRARGQTPPAATPAEPAGPQTPQAPARSVVYTAHDPAAIEHYETNRARVRAMVDRLVMATTGKDSVAAAWRSLVEPRDIVGIKISATGGTSGSTHRAVVEAIIDGLEAAGVPRANVFVWDRDAEDLEAAGYLKHDEHTSTLPCAVLAIEPRYGYDPKSIYSSPVLGKLIWGDLLFTGNPVPADTGLHSELTPTPRAAPSGTSPASNEIGPEARHNNSGRDPNLSTVSHYATLVSRRVTKIVNVPVFSDNYYTGIGGALYNVTIPNVDNWRRLVGPPHWGTGAIPEIYAEPQVGGRIVINIVDGLIAQIAGAPNFQPLYARHNATLYASRDAVALDATLLRQLEIWRAQAQLPPLGESAAHVHTAGDAGLGNFSADKIEVRAVSP